MKIKIGFSLLLIVLIFSLTLANCSYITLPIHSLSAASFSMQITPPPPVEDKSEIGSTTGIFIMGVTIVAITSLPILLRKRKK
jgi:hypothetical protein